MNRTFVYTVQSLRYRILSLAVTFRAWLFFSLLSLSLTHTHAHTHSLARSVTSLHNLGRRKKALWTFRDPLLHLGHSLSLYQKYERRETRETRLSLSQRTITQNFVWSYVKETFFRYRPCRLPRDLMQAVHICDPPYDERSSWCCNSCKKIQFWEIVAEVSLSRHVWSTVVVIDRYWRCVLVVYFDEI